MVINRIEVGLDGFASQSSLHSRRINSFSLYTLRLKGSLLRTSTLRFEKYLLSNLNGWRAPEVRSKVTVRAGPVTPVVADGTSLSLAGTVGDASSADGPIAVENVLDIFCSGSATVAGGGGGCMDCTMAVCVSVRTGPCIGGSRDADECALSREVVEASILFEG